MTNVVNFEQISSKTVVTQGDLDFVRDLRQKLVDLRERDGLLSFREHQEQLRREPSRSSSIPSGIGAAVERLGHAMGIVAGRFDPARRRDALLRLLPELERAAKLRRTAFTRHAELLGLQRVAAATPATATELQICRILYETVDAFAVASSGVSVGEHPAGELRSLIPNEIVNRRSELKRQGVKWSQADPEVRQIAAQLLTAAEREDRVIQTLVSTATWSELERAARMLSTPNWWIKFENAK